MDDAILRMIGGGKRLLGVRSVQLTGNYFTHKGIQDITKNIKANEELRLGYFAIEIWPFCSLCKR